MTPRELIAAALRLRAAGPWRDVPEADRTRVRDVAWDGLSVADGGAGHGWPALRVSYGAGGWAVSDEDEDEWLGVYGSEAEAREAGDAHLRAQGWVLLDEEVTP